VARVLNPLMSMDAKGSVGGITFAGGRYGKTVKTKSRPSTKVNFNQPTIRAMLGHLARKWGYLTDVQREAWKSWAINHPEPDGFGGTFILTGNNAFIKLNHTAWRLGTAVKVTHTPPIEDLAFAIENYEVDTALVTGDFITKWDLVNVGDAADYVEIQLAGPFDSPGRVQVFNQFRYDKDVTGVTVTETTAGLTVGAWYWKRARYVGVDGQVSAWHYVQYQPETVP